MDMLKQSIGMGMLLMAGHAFSAEITVTTTDDVVKDDKECSLREAIEYINKGMPEAGYNGCGGKGAIASILLEKQKTYKLDKKINLTAETNIKTTYDASFNDDTVPGLNNAIIEMTGSDQIFHIDDEKNTQFKVSLKEITLKGCGVSQCADLGGIIYNNELLSLEYVKLINGHARLGGAIYNVGLSEEGKTAASLLNIQNTIFENNTATEGGAVYALAPSFAISMSLFKGNSSTSGRAIVFSKSGATGETITATVTNSTFFKNTGSALNLLDGLAVNNVSVVKNSAGVDFNASKIAYLANSIILGNGTQDCRVADATADKSVIYNNLMANSCNDLATKKVDNLNQIWNGTQLFAGSDEGSCKTLSEDRESLFCPFSTPSNTFIGYLRPRILLSYSTLFSSPILNKGTTSANGNEEHIYCESSDQRGKSRSADDVWCDRGAIEIVVPTSISRLGQDIHPGEIAKFNILEQLGDSDLIPKEECDAVMGKANPTGEPWQDGCLVIKQSTVSKGKMTLNLNGDVTYTPNGDWHGADIFEVQIATSSTRFNTETSKNYLSAEVRIFQEPVNHMENKSVKTSGGALGWLSLTALFGLIGLRRYKK